MKHPHKNSLRAFAFSLLLLNMGFVAPLAAQDSTEPSGPQLSLRQTGLTPLQLSMWQNPTFQQRFTESYIAETDIEPRLTEEERVVVQKILAFISEEQLDSAIDLITRELERNPASSAVFDFTRANIYFQREQFDLALQGYERCVEKYPKYRRAWKNLGIIHVRQGDFNKAIEPLTRTLEMGDNSSIVYGLLGFSYSSVENFLAAESAYRMAILLDAETLDWKLGLARSFFKQQRFSEAIALISSLLEKDSNRVDLWLLQANAYIGLKQPMQAAEIYELVDLMGGSTVESLNLLGDIYINEQLYQLATDSYIRALELTQEQKPDRALRSAKILAARGALAETRVLVEKIESLFSGNLEVNDRKDLLKLRSRLAVADGSADEEARVLEEIIELDPLDGEALILLGQYHNRKGDSEKAIFYYERAAALENFEADAKVRHAQLLVGLNRYTEALPLLRRAQQINYRENIQEYLEQVERVAKSR
ncbi:MAG: tetratricopeptide repeat protein [Sumerlaeia bacterium]